MEWLVLELAMPEDDEVAALLVESLVALTGRGVEERSPVGGPPSIVAYIPRDSGPRVDDDLVPRIVAQLREATGAEPIVLSERRQAQEAWAELWRRGLAPRRVTSRIVVSPTWERPTLAAGERLVSLDPGMAFGTAEHATTRGALRLMDSRLRPGDRVADVGSGSGILSIAAALLGAGSVLAIEMDPWACRVARENVDRNGVGDRVRIVEAVVRGDVAPGEPPFDMIVANLETSTLTGLIDALRRGLRSGGWALLGGVLRPEADGLVRVARDSGLELDEEDREEEWWTGAFRAR